MCIELLGGRPIDNLILEKRIGKGWGGTWRRTLGILTDLLVIILVVCGRFEESR